jgi:hypothetical protein
MGRAGIWTTIATLFGGLIGTGGEIMGPEGRVEVFVIATGAVVLQLDGEADTARLIREDLDRMSPADFRTEWGISSP